MSLDVYLNNPKNEDDCLYSDNITHNLAKMAGYCFNLYELLWRPEELFIKQAKELVLPLEKCLTILKAEPEYYKKFNPENKWGNYENLVIFTERYLEACKEYPEAEVSISR